jgi:hypothetical protein
LDMGTVEATAGVGNVVSQACSLEEITPLSRRCT